MKPASSLRSRPEACTRTGPSWVGAPGGNSLDDVDGKHDLVSLSQHVFDRTRRRLSGLTDAEYFWEPVSGCWSVRVNDEGVASIDAESRRCPRHSPPSLGDCGTWSIATEQTEISCSFSATTMGMAIADVPLDQLQVERSLPSTRRMPGGSHCLISCPKGTSHSYSDQRRDHTPGKTRPPTSSTNSTR